MRPLDLGRETPSCGHCHSTPRLRSLVRCLTIAIIGRPGTIAELPSTCSGLGLSDHPFLADALTSAVDYRNTHYHKEPMMDITEPSKSWLESADFLLSSDVFEHVVPPVQRAFDGALAVLRPGGHLILTVPFDPSGFLPETLEHFPELNVWTIDGRSGDTPTLRNTTVDGRIQLFDQLIFHGGDGLTLEMRLFEERALIRNLETAGFVDITVHDESDLEYGIFWTSRASVPISARRPYGVTSSTTAMS